MILIFERPAWRNYARLACTRDEIVAFSQLLLHAARYKFANPVEENR